MIVQPKDYKYFVQNPKNFSPEKNKAVVNETIKETTAYFKKLETELDDEAGNRIDILGTYARYRFNRGEKTFKQYAGNDLYKKLIGEKLLSKVKILSSIDKLKGNTKVLL